MNQSNEFKNFLNALSKFTEDMKQGIYAAKTTAYDTAPPGKIKQNAFNRPAVLDPTTLNMYVDYLKGFNNILQTDLANEAKQPHNARVIKGYYEKIVTNLSNIDPSQTRSFETDITNEFNRFNNILFGGPNITLPSFQYPSPQIEVNDADTQNQYTEPEPGLETTAGSSLKQKAGLAANALRGTINKFTKTGEMPNKHPGWDYEEAGVDREGKPVPGYKNWQP